jgi:hypothetical protein
MWYGVFAPGACVSVVLMSHRDACIAMICDLKCDCAGVNDDCDCAIVGLSVWMIDVHRS